MTSPEFEALRSASPHPLAPGVWFGGDYNPEQWPERIRLDDLDLMERAHVNTATVGVFAWSSIEPEPGLFDLDWLEDALDRLHARGVRVVLATPTASPPPWFTRRHPEALPVTADGVRLSHGSRDTYNPAAPAYRDAARRVTRALAERFGAHPAVAMWHLHNEYGTVSHGPVSDAAFRLWLRERYGTLDRLNEVWNTAFWSQRYAAWDEITAMARTQYLPNPSQALDFSRFSADILLDCLRDQLDIVRACSAIPVTTNFMLPTWNHYDQWAFARELDVVSIDHYLDDEGPLGDVHVAFAADLARSFNAGRPWLLMEQSTSLVYDYADGRMLVREPGRIRRNTYQYLARGAMGSLFFQWRAPVVGAEFFHSAMVPHAGADSRIFRELSALGAELAALDEVVRPPAHGRVHSPRIAIVWSADAWWATQTRALPSSDVAFLPAVRAVHTALHRLGHVVDVVSPDGDLAAYDVVLVPSLLAVSDADAAALTAVVDRGGDLVVWHFSGSTDEHLRVRPGGYSGAFADVLGIRVEEHVPLRSSAVLTLSDGTVAGSWSEVVHLRGARAVAEYTHDAHPVIGAGAPAITVNERGTGGATGRAHYFSTRPDAEGLEAHLARILATAGIEPTAPEQADGFETVRRTAGADSYLFAINHSSHPRTVAARGRELLSDTDVDGLLTVPPGDVRIVREHTDSPAQTKGL